MILYIKVGSITNAQRSQRLLRSKGYKTRIKKIQNPSSTEGCGYALEVESDSMEPVQLLKNNSIRVSGAEFI